MNANLFPTAVVGYGPTKEMLNSRRARARRGRLNERRDFTQRRTRRARARRGRKAPRWIQIFL